jgi:hypothetical protein
MTSVSFETKAVLSELIILQRLPPNPTYFLIHLQVHRNNPVPFQLPYKNYQGLQFDKSF